MSVKPGIWTIKVYQMLYFMGKVERLFGKWKKIYKQHFAKILTSKSRQTECLLKKDALKMYQFMKRAVTVNDVFVPCTCSL